MAPWPIMMISDESHITNYFNPRKLPITMKGKILVGAIDNYVGYPNPILGEYAMSYDFQWPDVKIHHTYTGNSGK